LFPARMEKEPVILPLNFFDAEALAFAGSNL
jgi:hypothetical protein